MATSTPVKPRINELEQQEIEEQQMTPGEGPQETGKEKRGRGREKEREKRERKGASLVSRAPSGEKKAKKKKKRRGVGGRSRSTSLSLLPHCLPTPLFTLSPPPPPLNHAGKAAS
jgi:hypothetical protein